MNLSTNKIIIKKLTRDIDRDMDSLNSSKANSIKKSRRKYNKSMINNIDNSKIEKDKIKVNKSIMDFENISFLSNANLNVIKILNNCANNDSFLNKSSFLEDLQEKSILSITKLKRNKTKKKEVMEKK
jgi:hypothetical protein